MRVLLDTNIIIDRESHNTRNYTIASLYKWLDKLKYTKVIHPLTVKEIEKYKDEDHKETVLLKLKSYNEMIVNNDFSEEFKRIIEKYSQNENSLVDNSMLYQVYIGRVDLLITEDKKMHTKAQELNIYDKVFSINRFITKVTEENPELIEYKVLSVKKVKFGSININDCFFDSFKNDYKEFTKWFNRKCDEDAYICEIKGEIVGLLYLKVEDINHNYDDIVPQFSKKKRLKIGTFKVESTGFRLGERFLKIIFDNAVEQRVEEIYITMFMHNIALQRLKDLLERWGFEEHGVKLSNDGKEVVLAKTIDRYKPNLSPKKNFPNILTNSNKYILPIYPEYHTTLFPDAILRNENMDLFIDKLAHRYALQKVYVCGASIEGVNPGDLVLIYRTGETRPKKYSSVLSTIAIVDEVSSPRTLEYFLDECENRSVFSKEELIEYFINFKYRNVIKLLYYKTLNKKITLNDLYEEGVLSFPNGPRPFHPLKEYQFYNILTRSNTKL